KRSGGEYGYAPRYLGELTGVDCDLGFSRDGRGYGRAERLPIDRQRPTSRHAVRQCATHDDAPGSRHLGLQQPFRVRPGLPTEAVGTHHLRELGRAVRRGHLHRPHLVKVDCHASGLSCQCRLTACHAGPYDRYARYVSFHGLHSSTVPTGVYYGLMAMLASTARVLIGIYLLAIAAAAMAQVPNSSSRAVYLGTALNVSTNSQGSGGDRSAGLVETASETSRAGTATA